MAVVMLIRHLAFLFPSLVHLFQLTSIGECAVHMPSSHRMLLLWFWCVEQKTVCGLFSKQLPFLRSDLITCHFYFGLSFFLSEQWFDCIFSCTDSLRSFQSHACHGQSLRLNCPKDSLISVYIAHVGPVRFSERAKVACQTSDLASSKELTTNDTPSPCSTIPAFTVKPWQQPICLNLTLNVCLRRL